MVVTGSIEGATSIVTTDYRDGTIGVISSARFTPVTPDIVTVTDLGTIAGLKTGGTNVGVFYQGHSKPVSG